jgi:hypothetical protein
LEVPDFCNVASPIEFEISQSSNALAEAPSHLSSKALKRAIPVDWSSFGGRPPGAPVYVLKRQRA